MTDATNYLDNDVCCVQNGLLVPIRTTQSLWDSASENLHLHNSNNQMSKSHMYVCSSTRYKSKVQDVRADAEQVVGGENERPALHLSHQYPR